LPLRNSAGDEEVGNFAHEDFALIIQMIRYAGKSTMHTLHQSFRFNRVTLTFLLAASISATANAAEYGARLAPYINDDTFAVVCLDVTAIPVRANPQDQIILTLALPGEARNFAAGLLVAEGFVKRIQAAGAQRVCAVASLGDLHQGGGPLLVFTTQPEKVSELVRELEAMRKVIIDSSNGNIKPMSQEIEVRRNGDLVLAGMKSTIEHYTLAKPTERKDLVTPLDRIGAGNPLMSAVFCPGPDFRRIVREVWPELPGSFAPLRGELADRWISLEGSINLPPNINPRLTLRAKDPEAAEIFAKLWHDLPVATTEFGDKGESSRQVQGYAQLLVDTLPAKVDGTRVDIGFPTDASQFARLQSMFSEAADKSMDASRRNQRIGQFKELTIAMQNYHDVNKHLPPAAICDKDIKPLLSWRVAILPYIEQNELYKQFHLAEPWDSPHNRALIEKMPTCYADPDPKINQLTVAGKTTYQVPIGKETAFPNNEGISFREIKDGTSNTVLVVEVEPGKAIEWTKPEDWKVDLEHPHEGLKRSDRDYATLGFADGHVLIINPQKIEDKKLRAMITRAGGEVVNGQ
jgi:hypothetical protein